MKIGVGVEAGVTYHHLTLVRNMGCRPADKFPLKVLASLGHQEVDMGVEINFLSEFPAP